MKIKTVLHISDNCIRHVLKESIGELNYKYTTEGRRKSLQTRVEQFEDALETLGILYKYRSEIMSWTAVKRAIDEE